MWQAIARRDSFHDIPGGHATGRSSSPRYSIMIRQAGRPRGASLSKRVGAGLTSGRVVGHDQRLHLELVELLALLHNFQVEAIFHSPQLIVQPIWKILHIHSHAEVTVTEHKRNSIEIEIGANRKHDKSLVKQSKLNRVVGGACFSSLVRGADGDASFLGSLPRWAQPSAFRREKKAREHPPCFLSLLCLGFASARWRVREK